MLWFIVNDLFCCCLRVGMNADESCLRCFAWMGWADWIPMKWVLFQLFVSYWFSYLCVCFVEFFVFEIGSIDHYYRLVTCFLI